VMPQSRGSVIRTLDLEFSSKMVITSKSGMFTYHKLNLFVIDVVFYCHFLVIMTVAGAIVKEHRYYRCAPHSANATRMLLGSYWQQFAAGTVMTAAIQDRR